MNNVIDFKLKKHIIQESEDFWFDHEQGQCLLEYNDLVDLVREVQETNFRLRKYVDSLERELARIRKRK